MKVLGIGGSPRVNGNTDVILAAIISGAEEAGAETDLVHLRDYCITPCIGCEQCRKDLTCSRFLDGMHLLYPMVDEADALVLGSPTYNYNVPAEMKAFIDRLYPYYVFTDDRPRKYSSRLSDRPRIAAVFAVCEQTDPSEKGFALEAMSRPLAALGYEVKEQCPIHGYFDRGSVRGDESVMKKAYEMGYRMGSGR